MLKLLHNWTHLTCQQNNAQNLLHIPVNAIIHALTDINDVNASLPAAAAMILIVLSVILTLIGGLIPSRLAAKKDPVIALRTE